MPYVKWQVSDIKSPMSNVKRKRQLSKYQCQMCSEQTTYVVYFADISERIITHSQHVSLLCSRIAGRCTQSQKCHAYKNMRSEANKFTDEFRSETKCQRTACGTGLTDGPRVRRPQSLGPDRRLDQCDGRWRHHHAAICTRSAILDAICLAIAFRFPYISMTSSLASEIRGSRIV